MRNKSRAVVVLMVVSMIVVVASHALGQEKKADNMQIVLEKVRADKKHLVAENIQLTESEAKAFWPVYEQYQDELFLLRTRTIKLINDYADAYGKMTDDTAKRLLNEYMTIETLGLKLRTAYLPKFRKVLSPVKTARYYQIENKIQAVLYYELAQKIPLMKAAE
ncbi:MAG TPA: hypothetical protein VFG09_10420 [Thermodesulfovibrionales bacterium]|nr:hypothetical protein [Thermodesulfovibrionales bacterium]